jgi:hypothetical protein
LRGGRPDETVGKYARNRYIDVNQNLDLTDLTCRFDSGRGNIDPQTNNDRPDETVGKYAGRTYRCAPRNCC